MARIPLAINLESRTGSLTNARIVNGYVDKNANGELKVFKRPGLVLQDDTGNNTGSGLFVPPITTSGDPAQFTSFNVTESMYMLAGSGTGGGGDGGANVSNFFVVTPAVLPSTNDHWKRWDGVVSGGAPALGVDDGALANCLTNYAPISSTPVRVCVRDDGGRYYVHSPEGGVSGDLETSLRSVTDKPTTVAVGSYDGDGNAVFDASDEGNVTNAGWAMASWSVAADGTIFIKLPTTAYTWDGTTLTQVTDTDYPDDTVRGVVNLNGRFYVMDIFGTIWNSAEDDPTSWGATDFITAEFEPDAGVCLARHGQYIVAFGRYTTEAFYDAGNATASPLSPVDNAVLLIGCAHANSVAQIESSIVWVAQQKAQDAGSHKGRFVVVMEGFSYRRVSTPDIERILDTDDFEEVYATVVTISGRAFYLLTLLDTDTTLVYDFQSQLWYEWKLSTVGSAVSVSSLTQSGGTATATTGSAHGFSDGDQVTIAGATPSGFNLTVNITVTSLTTFTYPVSSALSSPATGTITATGYTLGAMDIVASVNFGGQQVVQRRLDGSLYYLDVTQANDDGAPIDFSIVTPQLDDGNNDVKRMGRIELIGDKVDTTVLIRTTDDDYATWTNYRRFDNDLERVGGARWGTYRRRAIQIRQTLSAQVRYTAIEYKGN